MSPNSPDLRPDHDGRFDVPLQLASRFMALVRSGRAYSVRHVTFRQQLENYLALLAPVLQESGRARFDAPDGDLCMNGERLPYHQNMQRAIDQLVQEFAARSLEGIEFESGVTLVEFQTFMGLFLLGERWKGEELISACHDAGVVNLKALPIRSVAVERSAEIAAGSLPETLGTSRAAWGALFAGAQQLLSGNAFDHGIELRHLKRIAQPLVDSVLAGERIIAALTDVAPGETVWAHAAHVALAAVSVGARLGLGRHDLVDIAVSALLHDAGHAWARPGATGSAAATAAAEHTHEGVRRIAWATTFNCDSLDAMRTALEHHDPGPGAGADGPALLSQLVGVADAYVTILARGVSREEWVSPSGALARVLEQTRDQGQSALGLSLVRALGLYPPGQMVELDDGVIARALVPVADDPERPWVQLIADARGELIPPDRRVVMPLPEGRRIARALPRDQWPVDPAAQSAA
jgi:hypothetical protein